MIRDKKPPITISDVGGSNNKPPPERGVLSYVGDSSAHAEKPKSKVNLTQLALAVGLAVLVCILLGNYMYTSRKDALILLDNQRVLEAQVGSVEGTVSSVQSRVNSEASRLDAAIANQGDLAHKSDLQSLSSTLMSRMLQVEGNVSTWGNEVTALEGRVAALEEGGAEIGVGSWDYYLLGERLYVNVSREGYYRLKFTLIGNSSNEGFLGGSVLEYYTKSYKLYPDGWTSRGLGKLKDALDDASLGALKDYDIYVELLVGQVSDVDMDVDMDW